MCRKGNKVANISGRIICVLVLMFIAFAPIKSQTHDNELGETLKNYFENYQAPNFQPNTHPRLKNYDISADGTLSVEGDATFASQPLTPKTVKSIYTSIRNNLPEEYRSLRLVVYAGGKELSELIPNPYRFAYDRSKTWNNTDYKGAPWVTNISKAYTPTLGLQNRHFSICASHGRYYSTNRNEWLWQRPYLYCTNEDLLTQTVVVPFLIPMLQNAGAIVYSPRERDWQRNEIIVDNDAPTANGLYEERQSGKSWNSAVPGFANPKTNYVDSENPFTMGTSRNIATTLSDANEIAWIPEIKEAGNYAVYVSYHSNADAISNAHYTVFHCGIATKYNVNQKMGGGTWVYLGTFHFTAGKSRDNCVILTNYSEEQGSVSADAVRFGGGMGNIARGFNEDTGEMFTSGLPRYLEGARYSAQWAGMPYNAYAPYGGENDYKDDINARSYSTNYLAGGSVYLPSMEGCRVPIELCLAVHSDAGYKPYGLIGTLGVCTTDGINGERSYPSGLTRSASNDLIQMILDNVTTELSQIYETTWSRREVYDRMYSESCRPDIPSAIVEMFSHQNFRDMLFAHDPVFKFNLARGIYKAILRYSAFEHGVKYAVAPLAPDNLSIEFSNDDEITLTWDAVTDTLELSAKPSGYIVYTRIGNSDFDNGVFVKGKTQYSCKLTPGLIYSFRVTAVNSGGESFPSETMAACKAKSSSRPIMIVNCFNRLSGPAVIDRNDSTGFDLRSDIGVPYISTPEYSGAQTVFREGDDPSSNLGASGNELEGILIAGNTFDYIVSHGEGFSSKYSFVSCSRKAVETGKIKLSTYPMVDIIFGLEKDVPSSLRPYKTFTPQLRAKVQEYLSVGGKLLVSGAYTGSDMEDNDERDFMSSVLRCSCTGTDREPSASGVNGMNMSFNIYRYFNSHHYAATQVDRISPCGNKSRVLFRYSDGSPAGSAFRSSRGSAVVLGFPLECIVQEDARNEVLLDIADYLYD